MTNKESQSKRGAPKKDVCRTSKLNIMVTADEKERIDRRAHDAGFTEHTVYVRMLALGIIKSET